MTSGISHRTFSGMTRRFHRPLAGATRQPELVLVLPASIARSSIRRRLLMGAVASLVVLLVAAAIELGESPGQTSVVQNPGSSASTSHVVAAPGPAAPRRPAVPVTSGVTEATAPVTPVTPAPPSPAPPDIEPQPTCRNSTDPRCGGFVWDPMPAPNQPLTIALEVLTAEPRVGEEVVVRVAATDPDAHVPKDGAASVFSDPKETDASVAACYVIEPHMVRFGPWTPPVPQAGWYEESFAHVFTEAGTFEFMVELRSGDEARPGERDLNPYADVERARVAITVAPAAGAPPSTN